MVYYYVYKKPDGSFAYGSIDTNSLPAGIADQDGYVSPWKLSKYLTDNLGIDKVGQILYDEGDAIALAKTKNQAALGAAEVDALPEKDIQGSVSVAKKGTKYDVLKVDSTYYWGSPDYYVVDVSNGTVVANSYSLGDAKDIVWKLDSGWIEPQAYETNSSYGKTIPLPQSAQKQQQQLLNPKPKKPSAQKPIGSTASSIVSTNQKSGYVLLEMDDGTYGVFVPSTGQYGFGYKSAGGAAKSANLLISKTAQFQTMGVDNGVGGINRLLESYENRMREAFEQASREMAAKQAQAMESFFLKRDQLLEKVANGTMTQAEYDAWLKGQNMTQSWYKDMVDSLSNDMLDADKKAMDMLNGYVPRAYADGMNFGTFQIEDAAHINTGFSLYNESTVAQLISSPEGSLLPELPEAKVNELKDKVWSKQKINSCVTQSVLQGESMAKAAERLRTVVGMSANAAMRTARTTMTSAHNMGRLGAGFRAKSMGIEVKKQWVATVDKRTRFSHRDLDREEVELEDSFSNGLDYPADPSGAPEEVYNCRCSMRLVIPEHEYDDTPDYTREGVEYEEWRNEKQLKEQAKQEKYQKQLEELSAKENDIKSAMPPNKTYSGIWKSDVTLDDYAAKKASIEAKEEYYLQQIANAPNTPWGDAKVAEAKQHLLDLYDFQTNGESYEAAKQAVQAQLDVIQEQKKAVTKKLVGTNAHAVYSDERKAAAVRCSSISESRRLFTPKQREVWGAATSRQQNGTYQYTAGSGGHNRPLSGFRKPYREYGSGWEPQYYVGPNLMSIDYENKGDAIRAMTELIQMSSYDDDIWLRRGCDPNAIESLLGIPFGSLSGMSNEELQSYVGWSNRVPGFLSCGAAGGTGFTGKAVEMEVFAPAGTQMFYADPVSAYMGENEMIIQRGASYTVTEISTRSYGRYHVTVEVHPEDGYDLFQQDPSEWTGPNEKYR